MKGIVMNKMNDGRMDLINEPFGGGRPGNGCCYVAKAILRHNLTLYKRLAKRELEIARLRAIVAAR
jgi:hypothetical protein